MNESKFNDRDLPVLTQNDFSKLFGKDNTRPEYFIPIEFRSSDMLTLTGALSLGVVVFANDREIMDYVQNSKVDSMEPITNIGNLLGREAILPIAAGAYFVGAIMKDGKLKKVGLFTIAAGLATQIATESFKKSFKRVRPTDGDSPYDFLEDGNNSFLSGHTSAAFSLATVIAEIYKDKPAVPYLAYGLATLTAYARMHDNKHWATDVLAGAVAGHLITKIILRTFEQADGNGSGLIITPTVGLDYNGVSVHWTPKYERKFKCGNYGLTGPDLTRACMEEVFAQ